jgi:hypothetical protein
MNALKSIWCRIVGHVLPARAIAGDCCRCGRFSWGKR